MAVDYHQTASRFVLLDDFLLPKIIQMVEKITNYSVLGAVELKSAYQRKPIRNEGKAFRVFEACGNLLQFRRIYFSVTNGVSCFQRIVSQIKVAESLSYIHLLGQYHYL